MPQPMATFDPGDVLFQIGGQPIDGFADGTFIKTERLANTWVPKSGAAGFILRVKSRNRMTRVTLTLMQGSVGNDIMTALHNTDEATGTPPGECFIQDLRGTTQLGGPAAFIEKMANIEFGDDAKAVEWSIIIPDPIGGPGSNV